MEPLQEKVLVTGASGYIASHIISLLLENNYLVRGTVRSLKNPKNDHIYDIYPSKKANIELVEAELNTTNNWDPIVAGCQYVMHVASPLPPKPPKNPDELIKPAVKGTRNVLMAAIRNNVKKVVVTASIATILSGHLVKNNFNEEDWSIPENSPAYEMSKYYAEKEVWKIFEENKDKIKITCINPGLVLGPTFSKYMSTSGDLVIRALKDDIPGIARLCFPYVDVRDVALAHLNAMEKEETNGKRYILSAECIWFEDIMEILRKEFSQYGYKIVSRKVGYCPMKFISYFDSQIKLLLPFVGKEIKVDNSRSRKELGIEYRPIAQTILDCGHSCIEKGLVPNKIKKDKK